MDGAYTCDSEFLLVTGTSTQLADSVGTVMVTHTKYKHIHAHRCTDTQRDTHTDIQMHTAPKDGC